MDDVPMNNIDILYFDSCPNWRRTEEDVRRLLSVAHLEGRASVRLVPVRTDVEAQRLRFLGSPTVRVDGDDVDLSTGNATTFGLQCRVYERLGSLVGSPPTEWIRAALGLALAPTTGVAEPNPPAACGGSSCP
jgi:hypothetical protein